MVIVTTLLQVHHLHPYPTHPTSLVCQNIRPSHGPSLYGDLASGVGLLLMLFMTPDGT
jgi:hypothetical protein